LSAFSLAADFGVLAVDTLAAGDNFDFSADFVDGGLTLFGAFPSASNREGVCLTADLLRLADSLFSISAALGSTTVARLLLDGRVVVDDQASVLFESSGKL